MRLKTFQLMISSLKKDNQKIKSINQCSKFKLPQIIIWRHKTIQNQEFKNLRIKVKNNKDMQWTPEKNKRKKPQKKLQGI